MHEIELKFQVPAARRHALGAALAPAVRVRLAAVYFDTADRRLAEAGLGLRLRREGRRWVQTCKGAATDGIDRAEHNVLRGAGAAMPTVEPRLHAEAPLGAALRAALGGADASTLVASYRTEIERRTRERLVRAPRGRVELALDTGRIAAGDRHIDVCEFEIELRAGPPMAVIDTARRWVPRFGLWLDSRSKAERGDLLARGETTAAPRPALPVALRREMSEAQAWQAVLRSCADQIIGNASQVASGEHAAEHVHQLRIGLRRLRSALRLFDEAAAGPALGAPATLLFKALGDARDQSVVEHEFGARLRSAMQAVGIEGSVPWPAAAGAAVSAADHVRAAASQMFLLDVLAAMQGTSDAGAAAPVAAPPVPALRDSLAKRLNRWHRQVVSGAKRFVELDEAGRHRLRKRAKRLRYAAEFSASLFEKRRVRRYLKALRALQDRLGAYTDAVMAAQQFAPPAGGTEGTAPATPPTADPQAMFALGWLVAQREHLVAAAVPGLQAFARAERFWKRD